MTPLQEERLLCSLLVRRRALTEEQARTALTTWRARGRGTMQVTAWLCSQGLVSAEAVRDAVAHRHEHILVCDCGKVFDIARFGDGGRLRCTGCGHEHEIERRAPSVHPVTAFRRPAPDSWVSHLAKKRSRTRKGGQAPVFAVEPEVIELEIVHQEPGAPLAADPSLLGAPVAAPEDADASSPQPQAPSPKPPLQFWRDRLDPPAGQSPREATEPPASARGFEEREYRPISNADLARALAAGEVIEDRAVPDLCWASLGFDRPVSFHRCLFGEVDLANSEFHKAVAMEACVFERKVQAQEARFLSRMSFAGSRFLRGADFGGAAFDGEARFGGVLAEGYVTLRRARFSRRASFAKARMQRGLGIEEASFEDEATFAELECGYRFNAEKARFLGEARFSNAIFADVADFSRAVFHQSLRLLLARFERPVKWSGAEFHGAMECKGAGFAADVFFHGARFDGHVDWESVDFARQVFLNGVKPGPGATFTIPEGPIGRLVVNLDLLDGRLDHERRKSWRRAAAEYASLKRVFAQTGDHESEDRAYYRQKVMERRDRTSRGGVFAQGRRAANLLFLDLLCGYGTKPVNILFGALFSLMSFAPLYLWRAGDFSLSAARDAGSEAFGASDALLYSFQTLANASIVEWRPLPGSMIAWAAACESLLGIFLLALVIVTFSRKVIR